MINEKSTHVYFTSLLVKKKKSYKPVVHASPIEAKA